MAMERVIDAKGTAAAIVNNYNAKTFINLLKAFEIAMQQGDEKVRNELKNYIDTIKNDIAQQLQNLDEELKETKKLAEILTDAQKGQLEKILENVLKTISEEGLLDRLCFKTPDGVSVSMRDALIKLMTIPQVVDKEFIYDENNLINGLKVTFTDGVNRRTEILPAKIDKITDTDGKLIGYKYTYVKNTEDGFYKLEKVDKFYVDVYKILGKDWYLLRPWYESNFVINIEFEPCPYTDTKDQAIEKAADINQDGKIGNDTNNSTATSDNSAATANNTEASNTTADNSSSTGDQSATTTNGSDV